MKINTPKYMILANWIKQKIESGEYLSGDKLMTENEFAQKFNFSRQTVRQALSTLEKQNYVLSRRGSGTFVRDIKAELNAQQNILNNPNKKTIGVISTYISEYMFPSIIRGIEQTLTNAQFSIQLNATRNRFDNERKILLEYLKNPVDGLIIEGTKTALTNPNIDLYEQLAEIKTKVVFINGFYKGLIKPIYVVVNDINGGQIATEYLISQNHKKIAGIFKVDDSQGLQRYNGYCKAILQNNLELNDDDIIWFTTENLEDLFIQEFANILINRLLKYTAIVCYNDEVASRLVRFFEQNNINIPEDISLISFDNTFYSEHGSCKISSIEHPKEQLGIMAAQKLLNLINNKNNIIEKSAILDWGEIMIRDSVKKL